MQKIPVYNPLVTDFIITYDINEDSKPVTYTARAQEITYFDNEVVADHVKKHLVDAILNKRGVKVSWRVDRIKVLGEISLKDMSL